MKKKLADTKVQVKLSDNMMKELEGQLKETPTAPSMNSQLRVKIAPSSAGSAI